MRTTTRRRAGRGPRGMSPIGLDYVFESCQAEPAARPGAGRIGWPPGPASTNLDDMADQTAREPALPSHLPGAWSAGRPTRTARSSASSAANYLRSLGDRWVEIRRDRRLAPPPFPAAGRPSAGAHRPAQDSQDEREMVAGRLQAAAVPVDAVGSSHSRLKARNSTWRPGPR